MNRKIIHIDCDCFYAAVEMRDFPELRGKPVAVGGHSKRRGVLATCNYEARAFGLHAAMPTVEAFSRCPHLQLMPARFEVYRDVSAAMHRIFQEYTDVIEPLSLDEAFLDVTHCTQYSGSATYIAESICNKIEQHLGITASAGVADNKFLAKVASDWQKPNGQTVIRPDQVSDFVFALPLKKIPGVGRVTLQKMNAVGLQNCGDLQLWGEQAVVDTFGKFGERLLEYRFGRDNRPVVTSRQRKSLSVERTFEFNLNLHSDFQQALLSLYEELLRRLNKHYIKTWRKSLSGLKASQDNLSRHDIEALTCLSFNNKYHEWVLVDRRHCINLINVSIRSLQVKVKLANFNVFTREAAFNCKLSDAVTVLSIDRFQHIFEKFVGQFHQEELALPSCRLLGLGVNFRASTTVESKGRAKHKILNKDDNKDQKASHQTNLSKKKHVNLKFQVNRMGRKTDFSELQMSLF